MHQVMHFEEEPGRQSAAKLLTKDEARRTATNLAKVARATEVATSLALRIEINSLNLLPGQPTGRGISAGTRRRPTLEAYCRSNFPQQQLPMAADPRFGCIF